MYNGRYKNCHLGWVTYIAGKRESHQLLRDHILKETDLRRHLIHEDGTAATSIFIIPTLRIRNISPMRNSSPLHGTPTSTHIPYHCLYSRNVDNLFIPDIT